MAILPTICRSKGATMTDLTGDRKSLLARLALFTSQELAMYEEYHKRLLSSGLLMVEDAEEAACCRVENERKQNG